MSQRIADLTRWRGLKDLLIDATLQGTSAVERVHRSTAERPFRVLKAIPPVSAPTATVEVIYNAFVSAGYGAVRGVTHVVDAAAEVAFDALVMRAQAGDAPGTDDSGQAKPA